jgi:hypothetical protein
MIYLRGLAIDSGDATAPYYSGRKGWHFPRNLGGPVAQDPEAIQELETLRRDGARYLVFLRDTRWWLYQCPDFSKHVNASYRRPQETENYVIFGLSMRPQE